MQRDEQAAHACHWGHWAIACALMAAILLAPALWNGFPLLQYDTGGYLARWFEGYLVPSRPAMYGLALLSGVNLDFWPVVAAQAAVTIWVLGALFRELGLGDRPFLLLAAVAALSAFTTLPWLTSILLTDLFAGLAVIALHLLVFGRTVGRIQRAGLVLLIAFSAATHGATLLVLAGVIAGGYALALLWPHVVSPRRVRIAAVALVLGVIMTLTANWLVSSRFGFPPGGYGIAFGRMLQDGIVTRYLDDHCPDPALRLCPHKRTLPRNADAFLWGNSVFNRLGRFDGMGEEMRTIVLGSLRAYPLQQAGAALSAALRQLVKVASGEGVISQMWHTYAIVGRYTPQAMPAMQAARQQHGKLSFEAINVVHVPFGLIALFLLPVLVFVGRGHEVLGPVSLLATTVGFALLANAVICGVLSNPHDRYGARLIWLAPLTLTLVPVSLRISQRTRAGKSAALSVSVPEPLPALRDSRSS